MGELLQESEEDCRCLVEHTDNTRRAGRSGLVVALHRRAPLDQCVGLCAARLGDGLSGNRSSPTSVQPSSPRRK